MTTESSLPPSACKLRKMATKMDGSVKKRGMKVHFKSSMWEEDEGRQYNGRLALSMAYEHPVLLDLRS
ncbi:hypothetical protein EVAR_100932_1 [Eumeta japonica]|uniref:Uncharacterized protein n=1 Tax=Eumeta variegata TaxID=151549 RepID=A0A4C2ADV5_EUMVA|nr:hypothetical protein EVAR_100932_1 [Eumeta japonica]